MACNNSNCSRKDDCLQREQRGDRFTGGIYFYTNFLDIYTGRFDFTGTKKIIMKTTLLLFFFCMYITGSSQIVIDVDKTTERLSYKAFYSSSAGFPAANAKYVRLVSGSPYFSDTWMKGSILINDSIQFSDIRLRLDMLEGSLLYLDDKNTEMTSINPVKAVSLVDTIDRSSYLFVHSSFISGVPPAQKTWYQLLAGEKLTLFKQYHKRMVESKAYASSITEQSIETEERYFIAVDNTFTRIKSPGDIAKLVTKNKRELLDYIEKNKLKGKNEADFISAVKYYDSLK